MRDRVATGAAIVVAAAALAAGTATYPALAAGTALAAKTGPAAAPAWKIGKKVPGGDFTAVVATGQNSGWAFGTSLAGANPKPTAWRRSGSSWTLGPFPGEHNETVIAAQATSATDVWAFGGTDVAHWNGSTWSRTSVARLLPATQKSHLNDPAVTGVFEQSADSVYATGNGNTEDEGGPMVLLHWNGHQWSKVTGGLFGFGVQPVQPIASDGHGGLWIPMPGADGQNSYLLHYAARHLTVASLPGGTGRTSVDTVSRIPGPSTALAGRFTHALNNPGANDAGVLLQFGS